LSLRGAVAAPLSSDMTIAEILATYGKLTLANANEAETRHHVIDRMLYEVLGWEHADIEVEKRVTEDGKAEVTDYLVRTANTAFCIEAKRVGAAFKIDTSKRRMLLNKTFLHGEAESAVLQARDYCRKQALILPWSRMERTG
jgi:predicted type IV restriction endonuclease